MSVCITSDDGTLTECEDNASDDRDLSLRKNEKGLRMKLESLGLTQTGRRRMVTVKAVKARMTMDLERYHALHPVHLLKQRRARKARRLAVHGRNGISCLS